MTKHHVETAKQRLRESMAKGADARTLRQYAEILARAGMLDEPLYESGSTALMEAVATANRPALETLVAAGASLEAVNRIGCTALHLAVTRGDPDLVDRLLAAGAEPEPQTFYNLTPFALAYGMSYPQIAERIRGAEPARRAAKESAKATENTGADEEPAL